MHKFAKKIFASIRLHEIILLFFGISFLGLSVVLFNDIPTPFQVIVSMARYFSYGEPYYKYFFFVLCVFFVWAFFGKVIPATHGRIVKNTPIPKDLGKEIAHDFFEIFRIIFPIVLLSTAGYSFLSDISYAFRNNTHDILLYKMDSFLFKIPPFISLPTALHFSWAFQLFKNAYTSLALVMGLLMIFLFFFASKKIMAKTLLSFLLVYSFATPVYYFLPCQDPSHFFVNNDRNNVLPANIQNDLLKYRPTTETSDLITRIGKMEMLENKDNAVPASCFPSMHAAWGYLIVFSLFLISPLTLIFSIPWILTVLGGGIFFAQHYAVDYLISLPLVYIVIKFSGYIVDSDSPS